jgi:hypothetical protein
VKIAITGAGGFLGTALTDALRARGDQVVPLSRQAIEAWPREIDGADGVINLAGEPMAGRRWTDAQKQRIWDSRVRTTARVAAAIREASRPPRVLLSASGIGFYPDSGIVVDESSPAGDGFLSRVCVAWEAEARKAESAATRVVLLRSGVVFHRGGGALAQLRLPFSLGLGGPIGSGRQWWAWIHRDDWVRMVLWALDTEAVRGPVNVCAPEPSQVRDITRALGRALHRPAVLPAPAFALRLALGQMADDMLLASQRAVPRVARDLGFVWTFPDLQAALDDAVY